MAACPAKYKKELTQTALAIVAKGKGILAADESTSTIGKCFDAVSIENTKANQQAYHELFLHPDKNQTNTLEELLFLKKICTKRPQTGLDGLAERCQAYYKADACFAKWCSVLEIAGNKPSELAIEENANVLAFYASICQANRFVPIVKPEILMDSDHDLKRAVYVTEKVLAAVYKKISLHHIFLEGTILKPNMVCPGADCPKKYSHKQICAATITFLRHTVPAAVPEMSLLQINGENELAL